MIVMVVVAVVATVLTAGAAAAAIAPALGAVAGTTAVAGVAATATIGGLVVSGGVAAVAGTVLAAGFAAGFVGSVASQLVGKAMGVVDHFSLRQAVSSGLTNAATAGLGEYAGKMGEFGKLYQNSAAVRGAVGYMSSYAANKLVGNETHFSWAGIAVAAAGAEVTDRMGKGLNGYFGEGWTNETFSGDFTSRMMGGSRRRVSAG